MMPSQGVPFVVSALLHAAVLTLPAHEPAAPGQPHAAPAARVLATLRPPSVAVPATTAARPRVSMAAVPSTVPPRPVPLRPPAVPATPVAQATTPAPSPAATPPDNGTPSTARAAAPSSPPAAAPTEGASATAAAAEIEEVPPHHLAAYLNNPKPVYPKFARDRGQQGRVLLAVHVGSDGRPLAVKLAASSGFPLLDNAARDAVAGWRFVPARRGQTAVDAWAQVPIAFGLDRP